MLVCVCVRVHACVCVRAHVCVCVYMCVGGHQLQIILVVNIAKAFGSFNILCFSGLDHLYFLV